MYRSTFEPQATFSPLHQPMQMVCVSYPSFLCLFMHLPCSTSISSFPSSRDRQLTVHLSRANESMGSVSPMLSWDLRQTGVRSIAGDSGLARIYEPEILEENVRSVSQGSVPLATGIAFSKPHNYGMNSPIGLTKWMKTRNSSQKGEISFFLFRRDPGSLKPIPGAHLRASFPTRDRNPADSTPLLSLFGEVSIAKGFATEKHLLARRVLGLVSAAATGVKLPFSGCQQDASVLKKASSHASESRNICSPRSESRFPLFCISSLGNHI